MMVKIACCMLLFSACLAAQIRVVLSSAAGDRLAEKRAISFTTQAPADEPVLTIDASNTYQTIEGFGATFAEAGLMALDHLPRLEQERVLRALFSVEVGAGFSLMKSPLAAFDFAAAGPWYSYDDAPGDRAMKHFSVRRDMERYGLITYIKRAREYGRFKIQSTMDYPPDWMLDQNQNLKPQYYEALAQYQLRYIREYAKHDVAIDYLSPFNEPQFVYCKITYAQIGEYIKKYLGPLFERERVRTKLQTSDSHNREIGLKNFPAILDDMDARKYIAAASMHGYLWDEQGSTPMGAFHLRYPEIPVWQTEVCYAKTIDKRAMPVYDFNDGDRWGRMIIADLENWASGWIYWNAILDHKGGPWLTSPEHNDPADNPQHPVVIINTETKEATYTGLYYYLAHFSKFVRPGYKRIALAGALPDTRMAAFRGELGARVLEVINSGARPIAFFIREGGRRASISQPARSIATYLWRD
jgi:glucosylceramidase